MSFSAAWLGLREPYDLRARNAAVIDAVVVMLAGRPSVTIADLACGTGSTFRALRPRIKARQNWRLADNDLSLLARAPQSSPPDTHVTTMPVDLNRDLEAALDGPVDLVTTSALLDLVSDEWLQRLAVETAARRLPIYAAPAANGSIDMGSILQEHAARIGLNLAINRVPSDGYWATHWMKHPMTFGNTNQRPTTDMMFSLFFQSKALANESGWNSPRFDRLLLEARSTTDVALRKEIYGEMQMIVHQYGGLAIPAFISLLDGYDRRLKGLFPIPIAGFMGYNFAEYAWWDA